MCCVQTAQHSLQVILSAACTRQCQAEKQVAHLWYIGGQDLPAWLSTHMGTLRIHRCALNQMSSCRRGTSQRQHGVVSDPGRLSKHRFQPASQPQDGSRSASTHCYTWLTPHISASTATDGYYRTHGSSDCNAPADAACTWLSNAPVGAANKAT